TGVACSAFTYPFGAYTHKTQQLMKEFGFKSTLSCREGMNLITKDPSCLYHLKRFNRPFGPSSQKFFSRVLK
ncbi:MAG: polysaccharide deacetylase family protein, partial [Clostridia bacterium]|nr:polysaccharide deacetylase family protein [Clostridia bacterium]